MLWQESIPKWSSLRAQHQTRWRIRSCFNQVVIWTESSNLSTIKHSFEEVENCRLAMDYALKSSSMASTRQLLSRADSQNIHSCHSAAAESRWNEQQSIKAISRRDHCSGRGNTSSKLTDSILDLARSCPRSYVVWRRDLYLLLKVDS